MISPAMHLKLMQLRGIPVTLAMLDVLNREYLHFLKTGHKPKRSYRPSLLVDNRSKGERLLWGVMDSIDSGSDASLGLIQQLRKYYGFDPSKDYEFAILTVLKTSNWYRSSYPRQYVKKAIIYSQRDQEKLDSNLTDSGLFTSLDIPAWENEDGEEGALLINFVETPDSLDLKITESEIIAVRDLDRLLKDQNIHRNIREAVIFAARYRIPFRQAYKETGVVYPTYEASKKTLQRKIPRLF